MLPPPLEPPPELPLDPLLIDPPLLEELKLPPWTDPDERELEYTPLLEYEELFLEDLLL